MQLVHLKRREFITLLCGVAAWPLAARAAAGNAGDWVPRHPPRVTQTRIVCAHCCAAG
jgi:hypothetical protein